MFSPSAQHLNDPSIVLPPVLLLIVLTFVPSCALFWDTSTQEHVAKSLLPFWRPRRHEPTATRILSLIAPIGDYGTRTALESAAAPSHDGVPFLIITMADICRNCAYCQNVVVCQTEQEARYHADHVVQTFRKHFPYDRREKDKSKRLEWLCAVSLNAEPLRGTRNMHWIQAVMCMSAHLFEEYGHGIDMYEGHQIFVWNSVICNGQPLDLDALAYHQKTGHNSRHAELRFADSLGGADAYNSDCDEYDRDDDMDESNKIEAARLDAVRNHRQTAETRKVHK